jgi:1,4-alpha-glucan branching enzyme
VSERGALALVLHAHMPYVEGFGTWPFGEEWLWEATATVYLPLLETLRGAPVTVGLTPVLCDQLEALRGPAGDRFVRFLGDVRLPLHTEDADGLERGGAAAAAAEVRRAAGDYAEAVEDFEDRGRDLVGAFGRLGSEAEGPGGPGGPEFMGSAATHSVLPLLATSGGRRLQVGTGTAAHARRFGARPEVFWLPECAYEPGLEALLAEQGTRAFCVDQTDALGLGTLEQLEPVATAAGPIAVPIDWETVGLVWDERGGYPAHPEYRDYHGRTTHDLRPWNNAGGVYDPEAARAVAAEHARDFVRRAGERLDAYRSERGRPGLLCCPLDAELLGHWWYEGQAWLAAVLAEARSSDLDLLPLGSALDHVDPVAGRALAPSSWGLPKDLSTWDSPRVAELAWLARRAELRLAAVARTRRARPRALARAARELLALQSSDWAFQLTRELAADYPVARVRGHAAALEAALDAALPDSGDQPDATVGNLAPELDLSPLLAP